MLILLKNYISVEDAKKYVHIINAGRSCLKKLLYSVSGLIYTKKGIHMKILTRIMVVNLLFLACCGNDLSDNRSSYEHVFIDSLNNDGDLFEIQVPQSVSVRKDDSFMDEMVAYSFYDSLNNKILRLGYGFHSNYDLFENINRQMSKLDSFYLVGIRNRGFFSGDSFKKEKVFMYNIKLSSECQEKVVDCHSTKFWFTYDSTRVDETVCKKIISSLKYRKM